MTPSRRELLGGDPPSARRCRGDGEQRTLMTLWSIARSPLVMGGDLRHLAAPTRALPTNPEVIAVNQRSNANRPHSIDDVARIRSARAPGGDVYVALFNPAEAARSVSIDLATLDIAAVAAVHDLWRRRADGRAERRLTRTIPAHGAGLYRLSPA